MAETNYLNIYKILISEKGNSESIKFEKFYDYFNPSKTLSDQVVFKKISDEYVKTFNGKFLKGKNKKRALTAKLNHIKTKSESRIIHGYVLGGITDADFELYNAENNTTNLGESTKDDVLAQPYYFLLFMPKKSNIGIAMLHTNDSVSRGITSAFFDHLSNFFGERDFIINKLQTIPKRVSEEYYNNTSVHSIEIIQHKKDEKFKTDKGKINTIKVVHTMSGFKLTHDSFRDLFLTKTNQLKRDMTQLIGLENNEVIETVNIKLSDGKYPRKGTIEQSNYIIRIKIDDDIKFEKTDFAIEKIFNFVEPYFYEMKKELGI